MPPRRISALVAAYSREDRRRDRRLMIAVRVGVNGSADDVRNFCAEDGGGREMTDAEILAMKAQYEEGGGSGD